MLGFLGFQNRLGNLSALRSVMWHNAASQKMNLPQRGFVLASRFHEDVFFLNLLRSVQRLGRGRKQ